VPTQLAEALAELTRVFPSCRGMCATTAAKSRQFLNVYLNEEDIRFLGGESCCVKEGDRVLLVPLHRRRLRA